MPDIPVTLPLGGFDGSRTAADQAPGTYAAGLNMRSVDPRSGRVRPSRRPGLTGVASGPVATAGDEVTGIFRVGRDTQDDRYRALTTVAQSGVTPGVVEAAWEAALPSQPLAVTAGPDGNAYVVMDSGAVAVVNGLGTIVETIPSERPVNFSTVDAIAVDEQGGVIVAYAHPRQVNGAAGYVHRLRKNADDAWEVQWTAPALGPIVHFTYAAAVLYVAQTRAVNIDTGPESYVSRLSGVTSSLPTETWTKQVAHPVGRLALNDDGDLFVSARANPDRPNATSAGLAAPSVSWTPMEPVATHLPVPAEELYFWCSAERASSVQGVFAGQPVPTWVESRRDPSDWDPIIDVEGTANAAGRGFVTIVTGAGVDVAVPYLDADAAGDTTDPKPGLRFEPVEGTWPRMVTLRTYGHAEKAESDGFAPQMHSAMPTMADAGNLGATFVSTWAVRVQNWADGAVLNTTNKVIFQQGEFKLQYRNGGGTALLLEFLVPGTHAGMTQTYVVPGAVDTDENTIIFSYLHGGIGAASSEWWINGLQVGGAFTMDDIGQDAGTVIGGPGIDLAGAGMKGVVCEIVSVLGATVTDPHDTIPTATTVERLEGFAAHRYGLQGALDAGHTYKATPPAGTGDTKLDTRTFGVSEKTGLLVKYSAAGEPRWWVGGGPYGNGVVCGPGDRVYTIGTPLPPGSGNTIRVRRLRDMGDTVVETGPTVWGVSFDYQDQWARAGVDLFSDAVGNLYVPVAIAGAGNTREIRCYAKDGNGAGVASLLWSLELDATANTDEIPIGFAGIGQPIDVNGVDGFEALWVVSRDDAYQIRRVSTIGTLDAPKLSTRDVSMLAVTASGSVRRLVSGAWSEIASGAFPGTRPWVATVYPYSVIGDGLSPYRVLDHRTLQLRAFEASTKGEIVTRSPIGFAWRRRVGIVNPNARHQLSLSAVGDVFDWDPAREVITSTQAVTSRFSTAAEYPDLIRNVVPWNDDLAIVLCDGSVWRQTGDPMTGGEQDQIARDLGLADDWAWCTTPFGAVIFLGTDRKVWMIAPDGSRDTISRGTIVSLLADLDLSAVRVEMRWSLREDALWLVVLPRTGSPADAQHWVWERAVNAWHPQGFDGGAARVVTAIGAFDGDGPDDVATLLGFADGEVRRVDRYADDDAGVAVPWSVTIGPLAGGAGGVEAILNYVDVTPALDGTAFSVGARGSSFADAPGPVLRMLDAPVGRRSRLPMNLRAPHLWLELAGRGGPFAVEELSANISGGAARKMR